MTAVTHLDLTEIDGRVRLTLRGVGQGEGSSLQEAADELVQRVLLIARALRESGIGPISSECRPDLSLLDFLFEIGEIAAQGGDIRPRVFGFD